MVGLASIIVKNYCSRIRLALRPHMTAYETESCPKTMLLNTDGPAVGDGEVFRSSLECHCTGRQESSVPKRIGEGEDAFQGDRHVCAA
jgi:hypothetical protein